MLHWDGNANTANTWSTAGNWAENAVPQAGDDLVFPNNVSGAELFSVNNLGSRVYNSIRIEKFGYELKQNLISVGIGGITVGDGVTSGSIVQISAPVRFIQSQPQNNPLVNPVVHVEQSGALLVLSGPVSGAASVTVGKTGAGTLRYAGAAANAFFGTTRIQSGVLELGKVGSNSINAIAGPLEIGILNGTQAATVKLTNSEQIQNDVRLLVHQTGRLNLNEFNESIGPLQFVGAGKIEGATSRLTLTQDVTTGFSPGTTSEINVKEIVLAGRIISPTRIDVALQTTLILTGAITGGPLTVNGLTGLIPGVPAGNGGTLVMAGNTANTYTGQTRVSNGQLHLAKSNGVAIPGDLLINKTGLGSSGTSVKLFGERQVAINNTFLTITDRAGLDLNGHDLVLSDTSTAASAPISTLTMTGGFISNSQDSFGGSHTGVLVLPAVINILPSAGPDLSRIFARAEFVRFVQQNSVSAAGILHEIHISPAATLILEQPESAGGGNSLGTPAQVDVFGSGVLQWGRDGAVHEFGGPRKVIIHGLTLRVFNPDPDTTFVMTAGVVVEGRSQTEPDLSPDGVAIPQDQFPVLSPGTADHPITQFVLPEIFRGTTRLDLNGPASEEYDRLLILNPTLFGVGSFGHPNGTTVGFGPVELRLNFASAVGDEFEIYRIRTTGDILQSDGNVIQSNGQSFRLNFRVIDSVTKTLVATHVNTPPAFQDRVLTRAIVEGDEATLTGRITEPDALDTFFLDVDWGDGTQEHLTIPAGSDPRRTLNHRYLQDGKFNVNMSWHDQHNTGLRTGVETITVRNAQPEFRNVSATARTSLGTVTTVSGRLFDRGVHDVLRLTVDWGDGSPRQQVSVTSANREFTADHQFARRGRHWVTLIASDESGREVRSKVLVRAV